MSLVEHAERELRRAGLFDKDADYNGSTAEHVLALMNVFARQKHSGGSAEHALDIFMTLARFKPLTALTSDSEEWIDVSAQNGKPLWQSRRQANAFSIDGGNTYYTLNV